MMLSQSSSNKGDVYSKTRSLGQILCWGLTTRQPLWVILCRLPEKGKKGIVEEMKERDREEKGK